MYVMQWSSSKKKQYITNLDYRFDKTIPMEEKHNDIPEEGLF